MENGYYDWCNTNLYILCRYHMYDGSCSLAYNLYIGQI
jgi:hypothetical protein